jgi:FG-GAP repeat
MTQTTISAPISAPAFNPLTPFHPIGADLRQAIPRDRLGQSVALSADGQTLVIGAPYSDQNGRKSSGSVQVYRQIAGQWQPIGQPITGPNALDFLGWAVAIAHDGRTIGIGIPGQTHQSGAVKIYRNVDDQWLPVGEPIVGTTPLSRCGAAIALSANGQIIAIGTPMQPRNDQPHGQVQVYQYQADRWQPIGAPLFGSTAYSNFGSAIALSGDGRSLAISAPAEHSLNGRSSGSVTLYQYVEPNWVATVGWIGRTSQEWLGSGLALSHDGQTIAIGATGTQNQQGSIRLYQHQAGEWLQHGSIAGTIDGEGWGHTVALSGDGQTLAGSTIAHPKTLDQPSTVRIYRAIDQVWTVVSATSATGEFGQALALSRNGNTCAIGAPGHDQNLSDSGFVRILRSGRPRPTPKPLEILLRNRDNRALQLIYLDQTQQITRSLPLTYGSRFGRKAGKAIQLDHDWEIIDHQDINHDGITDLLLHSRQRDEVQRWHLEPDGQVSDIRSIQTPDGTILRTGNPHWQLIGWSDIDQDHRPDLVWHNPVSDEIAFWFMAADGATVQGYDYLRDRQGAIVKTGHPGWQIKAITDLDGDGDADILTHLPELNQTAVLRLNGKQFSESQYITAPPVANMTLHSVTADNSDNLANLYWQTADASQIMVQPMELNTNQIIADRFIPIATTPPLAAIGDFNQDGISDLLLHDRKRKTLAIATLTAHSTLIAQQPITLRGQPVQLNSPDWEVIAVADFG